MTGMTAGQRASYRRITRIYGREGIVAALTSDFSAADRSSAGGGDARRAGAQPDPGAEAGSGTNFRR